MSDDSGERGHEHQIARRELDALVTEMVHKLIAPADKPLIVVEQLRGKVLRYPVRGAPHMQRITKERAQCNPKLLR